MASLSSSAQGKRIIQFKHIDGKRRSIRLGKMTLKTAEGIRTRVEGLVAARTSNQPIDSELARWVAGIGDSLHARLAKWELVAKRQKGDDSAMPLEPFLQRFIDRRTDIKPNTRRNLEAAKARLVGHFGAAKDLRTITPADADAFLLRLKEKYAPGTAGRSIKRAKQFFRMAVRAHHIADNPFEDIKPPSQANPARSFFITPAMARQIWEACPSLEWRLIFALSRYGGLRCPSEHLALTWADVDWEKERILIRSPKKEHLEDGAERWIPMFPELRPLLEEAFELAKPGAAYVIAKHRDANKNLRTQFMRIIRRAGLTPWPKLFHNLRASRETELSQQFPIHVVCAWLGHSSLIAQKHYLQVTDADFQRAAKSSAALSAWNRTEPQFWADIREDGKACEALRQAAELCEIGQYPRQGPNTFKPDTSPIGLDGKDLTPNSSDDCGTGQSGRAAKCGANLTDSDLSRLVTVWPSLPDHTRNSILSLADNARKPKATPNLSKTHRRLLDAASDAPKSAKRLAHDAGLTYNSATRAALADLAEGDYLKHARNAYRKLPR
jgi:integrase